MTLKRLLFILPLLIFVAAAAVFFWGLNPSRDPNAIPSVRIDKPAPEFMLNPIQNMETLGLSSEDLKNNGVVLLNFFASWCIPCRAEHSLLTRLAEEHDDIKLFGINYKDKPEDAARWLTQLGNPYRRIGADESGRVAIDWGLTGVPETFVINTNGVIVYRHVGPIAPTDLDKKVLPAIEAAKG